MESTERFDQTATSSGLSLWTLLVERMSRRFIEREHRERYVFASQYARDKRVLDIACGEGYGAAMLKQSGSLSVIAGDREAASIDRARVKYDAFGVEYRVMDAEALTLPSQSVDLVVSFETIEHLEHPELFLERLRLTAVDRADIFISTPNRRVSNPGATLLDRPRNPFHVREYTPEEFQALLGRYFEVRQLLGQGIYSRSRHWFIQKLERLFKMCLVVIPGGTYWLARVHPIDPLSEPTYIIAHCINSRS